MGKRLPKKAGWFKENNFTAQDEIYVGLDVHKDIYHVAMWHNGRIGCVYSMAPDNNRLLRDLQQIRSSLKNVVYEAGPTGYGLVRLLRSAELPAEVVATTKTARMADRQVVRLRDHISMSMSFFPARWPRPKPGFIRYSVVNVIVRL